jgi:hypothetical protein
MSKLIHICAPNSSTDTERAAEEKRIQQMFPNAGVVCLLEGWKIEVHDIPNQTPEVSEDKTRVAVDKAFADVAERIGSLS